MKIIDSLGFMSRPCSNISYLLCKNVFGGIDLFYISRVLINFQKQSGMCVLTDVNKKPQNYVMVFIRTHNKTARFSDFSSIFFFLTFFFPFLFFFSLLSSARCKCNFGPSLRKTIDDNSTRHEDDMPAESSHVNMPSFLKIPLTKLLQTLACP